MSFKVLLIGRPNVGKSLLFNRLCAFGQRTGMALKAIDGKQPGLTRDINQVDCQINQHAICWIDSGGVYGELGAVQEFHEFIMDKTFAAIAEADLILLVVDSLAGLQQGDYSVLTHLRKQGKQPLLIINKSEKGSPENLIAEFAPLAIDLEQTYVVSALQRLNIAEVVTAVCEHSKEELGVAQIQPRLRICIAGRINSGKSTLVNLLLKQEDRVQVNERPGTTLDPLVLNFSYRKQDYQLVDTAGHRRQTKKLEVTEQAALGLSMQAIAQSDVVLCMQDASTPLTRGDLRLLGEISSQGKPQLIIFNKMDLADSRKLKQAKNSIRSICSWMTEEQIFCYALNPQSTAHVQKQWQLSINRLLQTGLRLHKNSGQVFSTASINRALQEIIKRHQPILVRGKRPRLHYANQLSSAPVKILVHGRYLPGLQASYIRYLCTELAKKLNLQGVPLLLEFRSDQRT